MKVLMQMDGNEDGGMEIEENEHVPMCIVYFD